MADHDHSYKLLFGHPQMVRDLLEGFIGGDWLSALDFSTLERVSDSYISDDLRGRADDIVWRARCGKHYLYLLIEFQSRAEPFMAVRVLTYVGLLYQDLLRTKESPREGRLPAILPIVLHNGSSRWGAAEEISLLVRDSPDELARYRPQLRYLLIDEGSYDDSELARQHNLVAMLFRIENCRELDRVEKLVSALVDRLRASEEESLRRAFAVWLERVILVRLSGEGASSINSLWEKQTMLSENFDRWEAELRQAGRQEGRQEGEATLLTRQLQKRFGELPDSVRARLRDASADRLEHWGERLLDAASLNDLFDDR
jgi:hypothetical protein